MRYYGNKPSEATHYPKIASMTPSWQLDNVDPIAAEAKYTFYKPSRNIIARLKPGNLCKLIFRFESTDPKHPAAERMWVIIDEVQGDRFTGRLDNDPYYISDLKAGDSLHFGPENIIDTDLDDDEPSLAKTYYNRCLATRRIIYEGKPVGYLYREEPLEGDIKGARDSGWRMLEGDEEQAYLDDNDNLDFVSLGLLLNKDDSFINLLTEPVGSSCVRDNGTCQ